MVCPTPPARRRTRSLLHLARLAGAVVLLVVAFAPSARADASSLFEGLGPRVLAGGEARRGAAQGAAATTMNPAGLSLTRDLVFEGAFGYRPGDGANLVAISACDSTVVIPGCFYYHYLSADPTVSGTSFRRTGHEFGFSLSRHVGSRLILGTTSKYFDYESELADEGETDGFSFDVGVLAILSEGLKVGVVGYNVLGDDSPHYPAATGAGVALRLTPELLLSADGLWNLDLDDDQTTGRYGAGAEYFLTSGDRQSAFPVRIGGLHDATVEGTYVTGGLGYRTARLGLDVGAKKQVSGGDELMIQASLRLFAPTQR
jgi:hypothetical protein